MTVPSARSRPEPEVLDAPERGRFELLEDGAVIGFADYRVADGGRVVMPHTVIDVDRRGEGLGDVLVGVAVAALRARGLEIVPTCWFVADHLQRHPGGG